MNDVVNRAKAALEGVTEGPWVQVGFGNVQRAPAGDHPPVAKAWKSSNGLFIAAARTLVPELVAEVERLQSAAKTLGKILGKIIDDSLTDVLKATDSYDLMDEHHDGDWMLVFERLAELRPARDAALAEVERLRTENARLRAGS